MEVQIVPVHPTMTEGDVAKFLRVSPDKVRALRISCRLPAYRVVGGRRYRFLFEDVRKLVVPVSLPPKGGRR
jgi:excisionase family DNA binding protein